MRLSDAEFKRFLKRAKDGDVVAQNSLAACYATGDGVDKDYEKAIYWYKQASLNEDDDGNALFNLGLMYLFGEGVDRDEKQARSMLDEAIECGSDDACMVLAASYEGDGLFNLTPDIDEAVKFYLKATLLGTFKGMRGISHLLSSGSLSSKQLSKIIENLHKQRVL